MASSGRVLKRLLLGRAMRSDRLGETLLPKRLALPIFASDALSSVAYAPDEIMLMLGMAGGAFVTTHSWQIALAVVVVMLVVVASYRQNVHAYPSGGGDYEVATVNLGPRAGLTVASALLVDYVLTVAVSVSSGIQNAATALPVLRGHEVEAAVGIVVILTALNLRGVRESGKTFAVPVYAFMVGIIGMGLVGFAQYLTGHLGQAESARYTLSPEPGHDQMAGLAVAFLLLRAFSSGCAALTGVEAISNGVPAFQKPKSRNAATTLLMLGLLSITMLVSIIVLGRLTGIKVADNPAEQLSLNGQPVGASYVQDPVLGQLSKAVFDGFQPGVVYVSIVTGLILVLAANTAFNGFPVLGSILAKDGYLPRQLHTRGDRLAFSNGILILAAGAVALIIAYSATVTALIQLYIVGVFVSFTLSQSGMIRHWNRHLRTERDPKERSRMVRSRAINAVGAFMSGTVLVVVLITKFMEGARYAILAMIVLFFLMLAIKRHYDHVAEELELDPEEPQLLPSRVHAIVLLSKVHKPAMRALAYARATRPTFLEAVTVEVDEDDTQALRAEWARRDIPVPLKVLASPYREISRPVVDYVKSIRSGSPRDVVVVYIPEYVLGRWYEQVLHNQSALRLKARLLFTPGVMVASVPWQLRSSEGQEDFFDGPVVGSIRRGPA
ncbi:amino acid/polyamine/organocation transporter (APC superfamily) [Lapillicoccus jejuensis]|uniref:Amino acid/polyamine/organocation transporter (APC superfamily) n=2 Tax=Lapillicoccus jejuensis TaxID=402171 RepID=A0A542E5G3_9MICO|nr:amino acid/polyamine/organocation transporter (APC superfamily) [Lapillicoccus jejuensis]